MKSEHVTDEQFEEMALMAGEKQGYKRGHHQFVIVKHIEKDGSEHSHPVFCRISLVTGKPIWPGKHHINAKAAARDIEKKFGLKSMAQHRAELEAKAIGFLMSRGVKNYDEWLLTNCHIDKGESLTKRLKVDKAGKTKLVPRSLKSIRSLTKIIAAAHPKVPALAYRKTKQATQVSSEFSVLPVTFVAASQFSSQTTSTQTTPLAYATAPVPKFVAPLLPPIIVPDEVYAIIQQGRADIAAGIKSIHARYTAALSEAARRGDSGMVTRLLEEMRDSVADTVRTKSGEIASQTNAARQRMQDKKLATMKQRQKFIENNW
jgi:hypothetical protein